MNELQSRLKDRRSAVRRDCKGQSPTGRHLRCNTAKIVGLGCGGGWLFLDAVIGADRACFQIRDNAAGLNFIMKFNIACPSGHVVAFIIVDLNG